MRERKKEKEGSQKIDKEIEKEKGKKQDTSDVKDIFQ